MRIRHSAIRTPALIDPPSLLAWYDFSDVSTISLSGSNVTSISDKSGNGYTLTVPTTAKPQSGVTINSRSAINFTSGTLYGAGLYNASCPVTTTNNVPLMTFIVFMRNGAGGAAGETPLVFPRQPYGTAGAYNYLGGSNVGYAWCNAATNPIVGSGSISPAVLLGTPAISAMRHDGTNSIITLNGNAGSSTASPYTASSAGICIGNWTNSDATAWFNGYIGEVIVYKRSSAFTQEDERRVMWHLAMKWGIPVV